MPPEIDLVRRPIRRLLQKAVATYDLGATVEKALGQWPWFGWHGRAVWWRLRILATIETGLRRGKRVELTLSERLATGARPEGAGGCGTSNWRM
jgi:hypothetical protein